MRWTCLGALAALALGLAATGTQAADRCDRTCLEGYVSRYLDAMAAHDPGRLPWATHAHFTEDGQELHPGDGLWGTVSGVGHYKLIVADPEDGQVGFYGTVLEDAGPPRPSPQDRRPDDQRSRDDRSMDKRGDLHPRA